MSKDISDIPVSQPNLRLNKEETMSIFRNMANSQHLRSRNALAYKVFGQGIWLIQGKSASQVKQIDPAKAVYVPMASLPMFFTNQSLFQEKINASKEMLVAITYVVPGDNSLAYFWTKAVFAEDTIVPKQPPRQKVSTVPTPRVNVPSVVTANTKKPFKLTPRAPKSGGVIVTASPAVTTTKKSQ